MSHRSLGLFGIVIIGLFAGCGTEPEPIKIGPPLSLQTGPEATIQQFIDSYNKKNAMAYRQVFTGDFSFEFSSATNPDLVNKYGGGWSLDDETISSTTLFEGGTDSQGVFRPAASTIAFGLQQKVPADDAGEGRDPQTHMVLLSPVILTVNVPARPGETEGTTFIVSFGSLPTVHRFFLVRGDVANNLAADQPADSDHWYIWRWIDESSGASRKVLALSPAGETAPVETAALTWGALKDTYR